MMRFSIAVGGNKTSRAGGTRLHRYRRWYAAADSGDRDHGVVARWLRRNTLPLVTTDYDFDETVTLVRIELGHPAAAQFGERLRASGVVQIIPVSADDRGSLGDLQE